VASGMGGAKIQAYTHKYWHSMPAPLDSYVILYNSMENEKELNETIDQNYFNVTIG